MANVGRLIEQGRAEVLGLGSAVRQLFLKNVHIPGIDAPSPQFRATRWRAGDRPADQMKWRKVPAVSPDGVMPGRWPHVVVLGMHEAQWRNERDAFGVPIVYAVAYRLGETAFMVGDVVRDEFVGPNTFEGVDSSIKGVALRLGEDDLYATIGFRVTGTRHFYGVSPDVLAVSTVFPEAELPIRAPGVVLL